jgi:hypothetical protein
LGGRIKRRVGPDRGYGSPHEFHLHAVGLLHLHDGTKIARPQSMLGKIALSPILVVHDGESGLASELRLPNRPLQQP